MLYGMAQPLHDAVRDLGFRTRVYAPMGDLIPGMAYLVRRLLENTANESFVRQRFTGKAGLSQVIGDPSSGPTIHPPTDTQERAVPPSSHRASVTESFRNEPVAELRREPIRAALRRGRDPHRCDPGIPRHS